MREAGDVAAVTIRPAEPHDAEGIASIFLESARFHAALDPERYQVPGAAAVSTRYCNLASPLDAPNLTLIAELSESIIGFVEARIEASPDLMHRDVRYCHISEIAVTEGHRGRGVGGQLLRAVEAWGRARGAAFASLEHHIRNARAGSFYQGRMGYSVAAPILIKRL